MNQIVLVGRIAKIDAGYDKSERKVIIVLAISRPYKNSEGVYETDFIPVKLLGSIAENTLTYTNKGDVVGVKGRVQTTNELNEDNGYTYSKTEIVAEKVTFLSSKRADES